jgi:photosystem II stability/assembly factor-like uncharacterized protein
MVFTNSATNGSVLMATSQNGTSWTSIIGGTVNGTLFPISTGGAGVRLSQCKAVCWIPNLNTFIVAGRGALGYILKSTDNGVTWIATQIKQTSPTVVSMSVPSHICWSPQQKRLVIIGSAPNIMYSDDIGVTWTQANITISGMYIYTAITWNSSVNKWFLAGTANTVGYSLGTSIDGKTWTAYTPALINAGNVGLSNIQTLSISM